MSSSDPLDLGETIRGFTSGQRMFGRFALVRLLGKGGMGVVWLARDESLGEEVALKFVSEGVMRDAAAVDDLKSETRKARSLTHPHIVRIHEFWEDAQAAAVSMECVDGRNLSQLRVELPGKVFSPAALTPWVRQLCEALTYAHEKARLVHRDLKPANLMVDARGDLKVADFGISAAISESTTRVSRMASSGFTEAYASPQQLRGKHPTPADDLYSLGATLYELLTGKPPFYRGNLLLQVEQETPPSLAERREQLGNTGEAIPAAWEETIAACLAKEAKDRPQSVGEVARRLGVSGRGAGPESVARADVAAPAEAPKAGLKHRATAEAVIQKKSKTPLFAALVAAALLLAGLGYYIGIYAPEQRKIELARLEAQRKESERLATARGGMIIRTEPAGAEVRVGGVGIETSPATLKEMRLGVYEVTLSKPGYETQVLKISVEENRFTEPAAVALKPLTGSVAATTDPSGLDYELTSTRLVVTELPAVRRAGRTPGQLSDLPVGNYRLKFWRAGWPDQGAEVVVKAGVTERWAGDFLGGGLRLTSEPSGVEFRLMESGGRVRHSGHTPFENKELPVGAYAVEFQRAGGWSPQTKQIEIKKATVATASAEFVSGALAITSEPSGADVYGEGKKIGVTPLNLPAVPPGNFEFELRLKDFKSANVRGEVKAKETARAQARLEKAFFTEGESATIPDLDLAMVPIATGTFAMGSENGSGNEKPVTQVRLTKPYWLGATEVTQRQWSAVMGNNPSNFKGESLPMENVSWEQAMTFCRKLTERERAAGRLPAGYEYTLPSEAQWEYACRAGTTGDFAGDLNAMGWYSSNSGSNTNAVGTKQANGWGLYDMHGNVWEWCADWYADKLPGGSMTDPGGADSGAYRVGRGGGWFNGASDCRAAYRLGNLPGYRSGFLGFRLALSSAP